MVWKCEKTQIEKKFPNKLQKFGHISCLAAKDLNFSFNDFLLVSNQTNSRIVKVYIDANIDLLSNKEYKKIIFVNKHLFQQLFKEDLIENVNIQVLKYVEYISKITLNTNFNQLSTFYIKQCLCNSHVKKDDTLKLISNLSNSFVDFKISNLDIPEGIVSENTKIFYQKEITKNEENLELERNINLLQKMNENVNLSNSILIHGFIGIDKLNIVKNHFSNYKIIQVTSGEIYAKIYNSSENEDATNLKNIFNYAKQNQPSILLFDDIDLFFPDSFDKNFERSLTFDFLKVLKDVEDYQILIIGLTNNVKKLDPFIRKKFSEEILIDVLNNEERFEMISHLSQRFDWSISKEFDLKKLNSKLFGYSSNDLKLVFKLVYQNYSKNYEKIEMKHFEKVLGVFKPLSLKFSISLIEIPKLEWKEIGGVEKIRKKLEEMIIFPIIHKQKYKQMGISPPVGILFFGPPGTGKTMIAKAVATASESNFIFVNISDLIHSQIGESEKTLSDTFKRAKLSSPCIIFFDEIQAMFGDRQSSNQSEKKLISQFILELDDIYYSKIHVVVIGATNVPQNLDPSLLSPGRFERVMLIGPPSKESRKSILENSFKKMKFSKEIFENLDEIVDKTEGYTGADLVNNKKLKKYQ
eukprot:gene283-6698_t